MEVGVDQPHPEDGEDQEVQDDAVFFQAKPTTLQVQAPIM